MKRPRVSIAGLMLGIAIAAFPIALLASVLADRPMLGLEDCLDMGVLPSVTALGMGLGRIVLRRDRYRPFAVGFQVAGWAAVVAYVACCRLFPESMNAPNDYVANEIEPYIVVSDTFATSALPLVLIGFIWGIPQLLIALAGGGVAALVARRTIVIGSRSSVETDSALNP
jgi:hypothetical protein